jgi:hypothetical protein
MPGSAISLSADGNSSRSVIARGLRQSRTRGNAVSPRASRWRTAARSSSPSIPDQLLPCAQTSSPHPRKIPDEADMPIVTPGMLSYITLRVIAYYLSATHLIRHVARVIFDPFASCRLIPRKRPSTAAVRTHSLSWSGPKGHTGSLYRRIPLTAKCLNQKRPARNHEGNAIEA